MSSHPPLLPTAGRSCRQAHLLQHVTIDREAAVRAGPDPYGDSFVGPRLHHCFVFSNRVGIWRPNIVFPAIDLSVVRQLTRAHHHDQLLNYWGGYSLGAIRYAAL